MHLCSVQSCHSATFLPLISKPLRDFLAYRPDLSAPVLSTFPPYMPPNPVDASFRSTLHADTGGVSLRSNFTLVCVHVSMSQIKRMCVPLVSLLSGELESFLDQLFQAFALGFRARQFEGRANGLGSHGLHLRSRHA